MQVRRLKGVVGWGGADLQVGDWRDGGQRILLQQALLIQELSCSAVERRLEETIVQNIRQRLSQRHQNPLLTGPNW